MTSGPGVRRLFIVHMLAYALALPWGVATVPGIFLWKESTLLAMADERDAVRYVVRLASGPIFVAFVLPHLFGIPWIRSGRVGTDGGRTAFFVGSALFFAAGSVLAMFAWSRLLGR